MHWQSSSPPPWAPSYPQPPRTEAKLQRWRERKKDHHQGGRSLEQWTQLNDKTWRKRTTILLSNPLRLRPLETSVCFHNTERDSRSSAERETLNPFQELSPDQESLFFILNRRKGNRRWRVYLLHTWGTPRKTESFQPGRTCTIEWRTVSFSQEIKRSHSSTHQTGGSNPGCQVTDVGMERSDSRVDLGLLFSFKCE